MRARRAASVLLAALFGGAACGDPPREGDTAPVPAAASKGPSDSIPARAARDRAEGADWAPRLVHDAPFDAANHLRIEQTHAFIDASTCCSTALRITLIDRADTTRRWVIDTIADAYEYEYGVTRVTASSVVMCRTESHGMEDGCVTHFIDPATRRLRKRVTFLRGSELVFASDAEAGRVLGVTPEELAQLRARRVFGAVASDPEPLPGLLEAHPLPRTTPEEFARARPEDAKSWSGDSSSIEDRIGAWQADTNGVWFAKAFYDAEGMTGVGGAGFVSATGRYTFLEIPELVAWSVSALLVEDAVLWAGRSGEGEYGTYPGGLLQYDRRTKRTTVHAVPSLILRIAHVRDAVFLWTTDGLYVLKDGGLTWHHMEPTLDGSLRVVSEVPPPPR